MIGGMFLPHSFNGLPQYLHERRGESETQQHGAQERDHHADDGAAQVLQMVEERHIALCIRGMLGAFPQAENVFEHKHYW